MVKFFTLIILLLSSASCFAEEIGSCSDSVKEAMTRYKQMISSYIPGGLSDAIDGNAVEVSYVGKRRKFSLIALDAYYNDIFTDDYISEMEALSICELAERYGVTAVPQIFIEAEAAFAEAYPKAQVGHLATTLGGRGVQTS